jgi:hypothetical protein
MEQRSGRDDENSRLTVQPRTVGLGVVPLLTLAGTVSALQTEFSIITSELNGGGNLTTTVLLGGLCLGLTIVTALLLYKSITSWASAASLVAVMVVANCPPLFWQWVPSSFHQDKDLPLLGTTELVNFVFFLPACLVAFTGFALVLFPARKSLRTVPIAIAFAILATLTFVYIVDREPDAWSLLFTTKELGLLWQPTLAFFLGLSLWVEQIVLTRGSPAFESSYSRPPGSSRRNGFVALGILGVYFIALHLWTHAVVKRYGERAKQYQARVKDELADSLAVAPSLENLPPVQQDPIEKVVLMHTVAGWSPYVSGSRMLPAEAGFRDSLRNPVAPRPQRYSSGISYTDASGRIGLSVEVTTYPTADWARYELRHIPTPNALIYYPESVRKLAIFGNNVYQDGPYFYWSSGNKLVLLSGQDIQQSAIDEFLKAYLEKYPSSL